MNNTLTLRRQLIAWLGVPLIVLWLISGMVHYDIAKLARVNEYKKESEHNPELQYSKPLPSVFTRLNSLDNVTAADSDNNVNLASPTAGADEHASDV